MSRLTAIFLLFLLLTIPVAAHAQFRGGGGGFGRVGAAVRAPASAPPAVVRGPLTASVASPLRANVAPPAVVNGQRFPGQFYRPGYHRYPYRPYPIYSPIVPVLPYYGSPFYGYGYGYGYTAPIYDQQVYTAPSTVVPDQTSQRESELSYEVGRLSAEVEALRAEAASHQPPPPSSSETRQPSQSSTTPTALIFKDGSRWEVENYAIAGQTLWVMDGHILTKYSLADLDIEATTKDNRQRGIRFRIPGQ